MPDQPHKVLVITLLTGEDGPTALARVQREHRTGELRIGFSQGGVTRIEWTETVHTEAVAATRPHLVAASSS